jgi:hypothetical protein
MSYLIPDRHSRSRRDVSLRGHYQQAHHHRQKVYAGACSKPFMPGEILTDPGFEDQVDYYPVGRMPLLVNVFNGGPYLDLNDGSRIEPGVKPPYYGTHGTNPGFIHDSQLSTANPRTGTYHTRLTASDNGGVSFGYIVLSTLWSCPPWTHGNDVPMTCRVEAGSQLTTTIWATTPSTAHRFQIFFLPFGEDFSSLSNSFSPEYTWSAASTYEQFSFSAIMPASAYWVQVRVFGNPSTNAKEIDFDMDDASVTVT